MRNKYSIRDYISQELDDISDDSYNSESSNGSNYKPVIAKPKATQHRNQIKNNNVIKNNIISSKIKNDNHVSTSKTNDAYNDTLNVIVGGPVDSGKSTLIGYILTRKNRITKNLSSILDTSKEEHEHGITIDVKINHTTFDLNNKLYNLLLLDTPGHCDLFVSLIKASLIAKQSILILDITKLKLEKPDNSNLIPLGINHLIIYNHCIGNDIIVCLNKMDLISFSESKFNATKSALVNLYKSILKDIKFTFIPIVANTGLNVDKSSENSPCSWYKGKTLFQELSDRIIKIKSSDDLICHVIDQWYGNKELNLKLYIESGYIFKSTKAIALPGMINVIISSKTNSSSGSILDVSIRSKDLDTLGDVIALVNGSDIPITSSFITVEFTSSISKIKLTIGQSIELIIGTTSHEAYINSINDSNGMCYSILPNSIYTVTFNLIDEIVMHPDSTGHRLLSRLIARHSGIIVGCGIIIG